MKFEVDKEDMHLEKPLLSLKIIRTEKKNTTSTLVYLKCTTASDSSNVTEKPGLPGHWREIAMIG